MAGLHRRLSYSLLLLSVVSAFGIGLPTHSAWRVAVIWSLLVLPFTAYWVSEQRWLSLSLDSGTRAKESRSTFIFTLLILLGF